VNGVLVNRQVMTGLRDHMVITAQGQTVQVGQPAQVREWLDLYGGSAHIQQRKAVASANAAYQQARTTLEKRRERQRLHRLRIKSRS